MKKRFVRLALPALLACAGLTPVTAWAAPIDPVDIPDAGFRSCIAEALGVAADSVLTQGQLATVANLNCPGRNITDLTGAQHLTSIFGLNLLGNHVVDTSPLQDLSAQSLDLSGNEVADLTPLGSMPKLTYLTLNDDHITDLRPIARLAGLFGNVCGECGGGPRAFRQTVTLPGAQVSQSVPFTVTDIYGAAAPLGVPAGVAYADGTLTFNEPGTYAITWSVDIAPNYPTTYFSGSATITVRPDDQPATITAGVVSVAGTARVGQTLSADSGTWDPATVQLSYQWLRDGQPIRRATADQYVLTTQDLGHRLAVQVTGSAPGYDDVVVVSDPTDVVVKKGRH